MQKIGSIGVKTKIFFALFVISLFALLIIYMLNFMKLNKEFINLESKNSNECFNLNFEIEKVVIIGNNLSFILKNKYSSDGDITRVNIKSDDSIFSKDILVLPSNQDEIVFEEVLKQSKEIFIYPNDCELYKRKINLNMTK